MKDEVTRILKMVQEGKISPEDASELIDAFQGSQKQAETPPPPPTEEPAAEAKPNEPTDGKDPIKGLVDFIEGIGRDVSKVNWTEVGDKIRQGTQQGLDAVKKAADEIKSGNITIFGTTEAREIKMPLAVGAGKTLKVDNPNGAFKFTSGAAEGMLIARVKVRGATIEEAKERAGSFSVMIEESDHAVTIRQPRVAYATVDFEIQLPTGCAMDVRNESGSIDVTDSGHGGKFVTYSGNARLKGLNGPLEITSYSGDVTIEDSETSMLNLEDKSGDVSLIGLRGNINARIASGDLHIQNWSGKTLAVESVSGDVHIELKEPPTGAINVRTVNGEAEIVVPEGGDFRVSLSTLRGSVLSKISLEDLNETEQRVTGKRGAGTHALDVSGINGDISVRGPKVEPTAAPVAQPAEEPPHSDSNES
jgi:DUF4097 and DUF4098 domain-containing protein YvlB